MNQGITIKARLGLAMAFLAALVVAISVLGLLGLTRSNDAHRDTFATRMPGAIAVASAELYASRERLVLDRAAFLIGTPEVAATLARARMMRGISDGWWKQFLDLPRGAEGDRLAQAVSARRDALHQAADTFAALVQAGDTTRVVPGAKALQAAYDGLAKADDALNRHQTALAQASFDDAQTVFSQLRIACIVAMAVGVAAAALSFVWLRRAIARPLADALGHFDAIAAGDLRQPVVVRTRDEMGELLGGIAKMQRALIDTVSTVRSGSESISTATREIAAGNIDLSSRTEQQASALQHTASSMEQLTGTVKQNADNARQASGLAANASEIANRGNAVVNQVVGTMADINDSAAKIADIIAIIEGIAFQTNILALNAAVEAARAGEEGRGFAVVAGEVRSLAQRSSAAAKEIKALIDTSVGRVQAGSALVDEAGRTMGEIIGAVQRVTDIMGEIAAASGDQARGIDEVARAVAQMDEVTQQNAALVEQAAAAAQSLEDQAGRLRAAVAVFRVEDEAPRAGGAQPAARPAARPTADAAARAAAAHGGAASMTPPRAGTPTPTVARAPAAASVVAAPRPASGGARAAAAAAPKLLRPAPAPAAADHDWETF